MQELHADFPGSEPPRLRRLLWLNRLQHAAALVYLATGGFLIYQYRNPLNRRIALCAGLLLVTLSAYRLFQIRVRIRRGQG